MGRVLLKPFIAIWRGFKKVFIFTFFYLPLGIVLGGAGFAAQILTLYLLFVGFIIFIAFLMGPYYIYLAAVGEPNPNLPFEYLYPYRKPVLLAVIEWITGVLALAVSFLVPTDKGKELHDYLVKKAPYEIYAWIKTEISPWVSSPEVFVKSMALLIYEKLYFWYFKLKIFLSTLF